MTLLELKNHMLTVKSTTLGNLCRLFRVDAETIRLRLQHWIQKGKIRKCLRKPACGSKCFKCPTIDTEFYEWVESGYTVSI